MTTLKSAGYKEGVGRRENRCMGGVMVVKQDPQRMKQALSYVLMSVASLLL